jgi:conflict system STAND superfamily ATPase
VFLFYHSEQQPKTATYYKGVLFELLLQRYLSATGFAVELRRKHNSLEYDLEGRHTVDGRKVVGEAKAHDRPISGEVFSAFVGKLVPLGIIEHEVSGLFLSTSALTAEADDYYRSVAAKYTGITVLTGEKLATDVRRALSLADPATLGKHLKGIGFVPLTNHLLSTDHGVFVVMLAAPTNSAAAAAFAVFREDGSLLQDAPFLAKLSAVVPELQALRGIATGHASSASIAVRQIGAGLAVGTSWDDYRLPAAPALFVGRRALVLEVLEHVRERKAPPVLQVKSRSGVGKSSFLAFVEEAFRKEGFETELHDARDIKSVFDLMSVVQRFTGAAMPAVDIEGAVTQLRDLSNRSAQGQRAVFMVDQFEATFTNPELFYAYEALLPAFIGRHNLVAVFARKNDLLTTYDETQISLQRMNAMSRSHELRDFEVGEAVELIDRISVAHGKPVGADVKAFVLEFAQGFPWLIKRTMAHISRLVKQGTAQSELFAVGLRLDELFDEELEGLDELERDYLTRIAARLPADFTRLQREFDEDPLLPKLLDKLTSTRLLRMSGATYDTYNDVFKEYLLYRRLPEYRPAFIHRIFPQAVFRLCHKLINRKAWSLEELQKQAGATRGTTFNLIRELRNVGLLKKEGEYWAVPQVVIDVYNRGNLSEYVRRHMMDNAVISDLLERLNKQAEFPQAALPQYLRERFPFIQATGKTWETYATITLSWLRGLRLVDVRGGYLSLPRQSRTELIDNLGNLTELRRRPRRGSRATRDVFLPASHWSTTERAATLLLSGERKLSNEDKKGLSNLRALRLVSENDVPLFKDAGDLRSKARSILQSDPYQQIWSRIDAGQEIFSLVKGLEATDAADATVHWRCKVFAHWGRELGLVKQKRFRQARARPTGSKS